ncbi:MAG: S8 family peptidase [Bacteroidota bacterium]
MNNFRSLLLVGALLSSLSVIGQEENRYFAYFKHKGGDGYPYSLTSPLKFLTQRALDRRNKQTINLDSSDLPVNQDYVNALRAEGAKVFFVSKWLNGALFQASSLLETEIRQLSFVDSLRLLARGTRLLSEQEEPSDPLFFKDPKNIFGSTDMQLTMLGADLMLADSINGAGIRIAVLDNGFTGVNQYSPFRCLWEKNQIIATRDFVENSGNVFQFGSHGTSVFSIIGAFFETDSTRFQGIAPGAEFILCITEDDQGENTIEEYNWLLGAEYADSLGVDIINSSLGYRTFDLVEQNYAFSDLDGKTAVISSGAQLAARKGIVVVTSAGNTGRRSYPGNLINHPSDADSVLTVGSVDVDFTRSEFSSVGPTTDGRIKPDVSAFGNGTAIVEGNGDIMLGGGTSFSSPLIAGFAAGIWQSNPDWTSHQVIASIRNSGHKVLSPDSLVGYGVPNYSYAVNGLPKTLDIQDIFEDKVTIYPNPFSGNTLYLQINGAVKGGLMARMLDPNGKEVYNKYFPPEQVSDNMELVLDQINEGVYYLFLQSKATKKVVKLINF